MSAAPQSSNPFRRKTPTTLPSAMSTRPSTNTYASSQYRDQSQENGSLEQIAIPKKVTKKVRVQSPPPPSPSTPSIPDSASTVGEDSYTTDGRPPSPPVPRAEDPFDSVTSDISEDEGSGIPSKAPANPFSRTLDTMEHPEREATMSNPAPNIAQAGKPSLDVEAFSRLLMTGNAGLATPPAQPAVPSHVAHALGDGGSSTDASSISRQSIFEAVQGPLPESPRTSHEISETEDDRRGLISEPSAATRKKPPPPSSRHGKLIKVELRDEGTSSALQSPPTPGSITSQHYFSSSPRSQTDLNKPLPPAPTRASHDSDRESVFDKESAGKTPEPPSPSSSIRKKNPPAPPLARRHSQMISDSKLTRDPTRLSLKPEEETSRSYVEENRRPSADSIKAPPPPPSRRPGSIRGSSHAGLTSPSTVSLPPPPPARGSSRSFSGGKPPSILSLDLSSASKRTPAMAPPPPPPRHSRRSMEVQSPTNSQRPSGEYLRQSSESARRGSQQEAPLEISEQPPNKHDILADLSKLQREIDALRQSETGKIT
ncbi:hypothetical protein VTL71DRAFT_4412 [Oculimacula yallundae]|uniref:Uncharacterized protein n=1 Tax=Oculimacula yallundae TaxID=86028 RepID=A0ABR4C1Y4_9HELO